MAQAKKESQEGGFSNPPNGGLESPLSNEDLKKKEDDLAAHEAAVKAKEDEIAAREAAEKEAKEKADAKAKAEAAAKAKLEAESKAKEAKKQREIDAAMKSVGITRDMLDDRAGQRPVVDHGDKIVFHCMRKRPDGTFEHFERFWYRGK